MTGRLVSYQPARATHVGYVAAIESINRASYITSSHITIEPLSQLRSQAATQQHSQTAAHIARIIGSHIASQPASHTANQPSQPAATHKTNQPHTQSATQLAIASKANVLTLRQIFQSWPYEILVQNFQKFKAKNKHQPYAPPKYRAYRPATWKATLHKNQKNHKLFFWSKISGKFRSLKFFLVLNFRQFRKQTFRRKNYKYGAFSTNTTLLFVFSPKFSEF